MWFTISLWMKLIHLHTTCFSIKNVMLVQEINFSFNWFMRMTDKWEHDDYRPEEIFMDLKDSLKLIERVADEFYIHLWKYLYVETLYIYRNTATRCQKSNVQILYFSNFQHNIVITVQISWWKIMICSIDNFLHALKIF